MEEQAYESALACALRLINWMDAEPGLPKHLLLSRLVFAILDVLHPSDTWED